MKKLTYTGIFLLLSAGFMSSCSYKTCPAYSGSKPYYSQQTAPVAPAVVAPAIKQESAR